MKMKVHKQGQGCGDTVILKLGKEGEEATLYLYGMRNDIKKYKEVEIK